MVTLSNRIFSVNCRRTSIRLCGMEWRALDEVCNRERIHRNTLVSMIDHNKSTDYGLAYATRLFLLMYYKNWAHDPSSKDLVPLTLQTLE